MRSRRSNGSERGGDRAGSHKTTAAPSPPCRCALLRFSVRKSPLPPLENPPEHRRQKIDPVAPVENLARPRGRGISWASRQEGAHARRADREEAAWNWRVGSSSSGPSAASWTGTAAPSPSGVNIPRSPWTRPRWSGTRARRNRPDDRRCAAPSGMRRRPCWRAGSRRRRRRSSHR